MQLVENPKRYQLKINRFQTVAKIGCTEQERFHPQPVEFDVAILFHHRPQACLSDQLESTVCYANVCERLQSVCQNQEYQLIESLAQESFKEVKALSPVLSHVSLTITKMKPPVPGLAGGASFTIGDTF